VALRRNTNFRRYATGSARCAQL